MKAQVTILVGSPTTIEVMDPVSRLRLFRVEINPEDSVFVKSN